MQGKTKERWFELCEQAANEQDPKKLLVLVTEISRLLEEKKRRVLPKNRLANHKKPAKQPDAARL
jgi:hypothetical protein